MESQIALLRGVNLGAHNRVAMARLRELLTAAGYGSVRTHLQSGNVVLTADTAADDTAERISAELAREYGAAIPVLVRTVDELADVVAADPFGSAATDPSRYLVQFRDTAPDPAPLAAAATGAERYAVVGREIYLWLPNGVHSSKLAAAVNRAGGTGRNWRTVLRLLELAREIA
ncbi:DUF1697 domain-containing protein [Actinocatenispora rupis]|uniref:DUF1697 domain-containing protein n=1 Tax=Actinocatenispora rupis TaxID=519421 RepID=A0A8J3JBQ8_9ACTN|nr:DUF1697 domain-containing protein [Actinocatenispora rupis]GID13839.1 hypothetical protein Aru02nite_47280 [Actinocatenispora rupis]